MFSRTRYVVKVAQRSFSTAPKGTHVPNRRNALVGFAGATVGTMIGAAYFSPPVTADVLESGDLPSNLAERSKKFVKPLPPNSGKDELDTFTWGSNKYHTISFDDQYDPRTPTLLSSVSGQGVGLRDLAFHEKHAACVDASGNVYQWGDGYFATESSSSRRPKLTLRNKDIIQVALSATKVYALSNSGKIYVISAEESKQAPNNETPGVNGSFWDVSRLWREDPTVDFIELQTETAFGKNERFTSVSSGRAHVLALTSTGRAFATAINSQANSHGQLGLRKVKLLSPTTTGAPTRSQVDLMPKALQDPFANTTPAIRRIDSSAPAAAQAMIPSNEVRDETDIRYCDTLFEIPALKGVSVAQLVAGSRSSYARTTKEGRVLAWGANEFGQMALRPNFTFEYVPVPTEVVLSKNYSRGTAVECVDIAAGGDMVYFTVTSTSTTSQPSATSIDLLAAGMGQYGSLGNNLYTQAQGNPVKVRNVSGVQEYNEAAQSAQPLAPRSVSVSPTHHAIVVMDTWALDGNTSRDEARKGRDVMVWGYNTDYQLGLGKRSNMPQPIPLPAAAFRGGYDVDHTVDRMMTRERKVDVLRDLQGNKVAKNAKVEQTVVAGWGCSAVYWKVAN